jgi:hypothetical protein
VDCLQFCDKRDLLIARDQILRDFGFEGRKRAFSRLLSAAEDLRNGLAHSQQDLTEALPWNKLIDVVSQVESLVHQSDRLVEANAARAAGI